MSKALDQLEDSLLIAKAQRGDSLAFRRLVETYDPRLWYFLRRMLNDDERTADVLQEVWLCVFKSLHRLNRPSAFRVWIYRIAHDCAVSELRRIGREIPVQQLDDANHPSDEPEPTTITVEAAELVHRGLTQLAIDHRRVLTLFYLEEMGVSEIAEVLGCNPGTVKSRLHYARAALARWIKEQNP